MESGDVTVRDAREGDLDHVLELYTHLHESDAPLPGRQELEALWDAIVRDHNLRYLLAEHDGRPVATCALTIVPNLTRGARPYALVENVVTHPEYRRRGIGRAMLRSALALAWDVNCYKVMLLTGQLRDEIFRFYESAGFVRGEKEGFVAHHPS